MSEGHYGACSALGDAHTAALRASTVCLQGHKLPQPVAVILLARIGTNAANNK